MCCPHDCLGHELDLSHARGKVKRPTATGLTDVLCLFISDGLDLIGVNKIHRLKGKDLDAAAETKKQQLRLPQSKVFPTRNYRLAGE
jgi:hypothetical protein